MYNVKIDKKRMYSDMFNEFGATEGATTVFKRPRSYGTTGNMLADAVVQSTTPEGDESPEEIDPETVRQQVADLQLLSDAGAPINTLVSMLELPEEDEAVVRSSVPIRKKDPGSARKKQMYEFVKMQLEGGDNPFTEREIKNFAGTFYNIEKGDQYAKLGIELVYDSIISDQTTDPVIRERAISNAREFARFFGLARVQRELYRIKGLVERLGNHITLRSTNNNSVVQISAPYERAKAHYVSLGSEHEYLFKYQATDSKVKLAVAKALRIHETNAYSLEGSDLKKWVTVAGSSVSAPNKRPEVFYRTQVKGPDSAFVHYLKTSPVDYNTTDSFTHFCNSVLETSSNNFYGKGDIANVLLRLSKCYYGYHKSQENKTRYSIVYEGEWVFIDALSEAAKAERVKRGAPSLFKDYQAPNFESPPGVWDPTSGVGASSFARAMWYLGDYLMFAWSRDEAGNLVRNPDGVSKYKILGRIGSGSENVTPRTWFKSFVTKKYIDDATADRYDGVVLQDDNGKYILNSTGEANPINLNSEAGMPYPSRAKKLNVLDDAFRMADEIYSRASEDNSKGFLKRTYPELFLVVAKPKPEVFELAVPVPENISYDTDQASVSAWLSKNDYLPKGRAIFIPCPWASIPFGLINSACNHTYESLFRKVFDDYCDEKRMLSIEELSQIIIPMKDLSFAHGLFDFFFRRVQCIQPFNTEPLVQISGFGSSTYADNIYVWGILSRDFLTGEDTIVQVYNEDTRGYDTITTITSIRSGQRVFVSMDGAKAESSTDQIDVTSYLKALSVMFSFPPDVHNFVMNAVLPGVVGGNIVFGNSQFYLPFQGSGNQLTFSLNDFKMAQVLHHYCAQTVSGKNHVVDILDIISTAKVYGVELTVERVIVLPPLGTLLIESERHEVDVDLLGLSARCITTPSPGGYNVAVVPVLALERETKAFVYTKSPEKGAQGMEAEANRLLNFALKMVSLLLSGAILHPAQSVLALHAISENVVALRDLFTGGEFVDRVKNVSERLADDSVSICTVEMIVGDNNLSAILSECALISTSPEVKRNKLGTYFLRKYSEIVSYRASYAHRLVLINNPAIKSPFTKRSVFSSVPLWHNVTIDGDIKKNIDNNSWTRSPNYAEDIFSAILGFDYLHDDIRDKFYFWPSEFKLDNAGHVKSVKFLVNDPAFVEKRMAFYDFYARNSRHTLNDGQLTEKQLGTLGERFKHCLHWYLLEMPERSTDYDRVIAESNFKLSEARKVALQKTAGRMTAGQRRSESIVEAVYGPNFNPTTQKYGRPTELLITKDNEMKRSATNPEAVDQLYQTFSGFVVSKFSATKPTISFNTSLQSAVTASVPRLPADYIFRLASKALLFRVECFATALIGLISMFISVEPVFTYFDSMTDDIVDRIANYNTTTSRSLFTIKVPDEMSSVSGERGGNPVGLTDWTRLDGTVVNVATVLMCGPQDPQGVLRTMNLIRSKSYDPIFDANTKDPIERWYVKSCQRLKEYFDLRRPIQPIIKMVRFLTNILPFQRTISGSVNKLQANGPTSQKTVDPEVTRFYLSQLVGETNQLVTPETKLIYDTAARLLTESDGEDLDSRRYNIGGVLVGLSVERVLGTNIARPVEVFEASRPKVMPVRFFIRSTSANHEKVSSVLDCYYSYCGNINMSNYKQSRL